MLKGVATLEERLAPEDGFVNGLDIPTGADLTVFLVCKSGIWQFAMKELFNQESECKAFPRVHALAERTARIPAVAQYVSTSKTFHAVLPESKLEKLAKKRQQIILKMDNSTA